APVHSAGAMLYSHGDAGGGPLVLGLSPHPTAAAPLEEGERGLVPPQHPRPVFLRPACMVLTPCKPCRLVCRGDERLLSCKAVSQPHCTENTANRPRGNLLSCFFPPNR